MRPLAACCLVVSLAACRSYRVDDDAFVRGLRNPPVNVGAPASLTPLPAAVGQWALYRQTKGGAEVGYQYVSATHDPCGDWLEFVWAQPSRRTVSKVCYRELPDLAVKVARWANLVRVMVTEDRGELPIALDLRNAQNTDAAAWRGLAHFHENLDAGRWRDDSFARDDVDVPAGHFARAVRTVGPAQTTWFHPAVPLTGLVKSTASDGTAVELVAYGDSGARTLVPNVPGRSDYAECREQPAVGTHLWRMRCHLHNALQDDVVQNAMGSPHSD